MDGDKVSLWMAGLWKTRKNFERKTNGRSAGKVARIGDWDSILLKDVAVNLACEVAILINRNEKAGLLGQSLFRILMFELRVWTLSGGDFQL